MTLVVSVLDENSKHIEKSVCRGGHIDLSNKEIELLETRKAERTTT